MRRRRAPRVIRCSDSPWLHSARGAPRWASRAGVRGERGDSPIALVLPQGQIRNARTRRVSFGGTPCVEWVGQLVGVAGRRPAAARVACPQPPGKDRPTGRARYTHERPARMQRTAHTRTNGKCPQRDASRRSQWPWEVIENPPTRVERGSSAPTAWLQARARPCLPPFLHRLLLRPTARALLVALEEGVRNLEPE